MYCWMGHTLRPTPPVLSPRMDYDPLRRGFAEFVGTFALVFVGAGSIVTLTKVFLPGINGPQAQDIYGGLTLVAVALTA